MGIHFTVVTNGVGAKLLTFKPLLGYPGILRFDFQICDGSFRGHFEDFLRGARVASFESIGSGERECWYLVDV